MSDSTLESQPSPTPLADLGPLAWVLDELRKSLEVATKSVHRFVRESDHARHNEHDAVDPAPLRMARQHLHQAVGALELVGLQAPAQVVRAMEAAVKRFVQKPHLCTADAAADLERAGFALMDYLGAVLGTRPVRPLSLFPQYRSVQELAAAERVHPADLWDYERRDRRVDAPASADIKAMQPNAALRSMFDRLVLLVVKTHSPAAAQQLVRLSAGLSVGAPSPELASFWRVTAAFFEAVALNALVAVDVYVKRAASRVLLQFAGLMGDRPGAAVSETLLRDLLFFCAQSRLPSDAASAHLGAVRTSFGLDGEVAVDYTRSSLGRFDPALLVQARKRIHAAKESWSLFSGGDTHRSRQMVDQYGLLADSLLKLHPGSTLLAQALVRAVDLAARDPNTAQRPDLSMEVATTTLYLEAAFEDFDPGEAAFTERTQALAARLESVISGADAQPLEPWMEQLYRRVSDKHTMGSVVDELKVSLADTEQALDQFFRMPRERAVLHQAVNRFSQMKGVFSVLGLEPAVQAVASMRAAVEELLIGSAVPADEPDTDLFRYLGDNLSALGFLVDMLHYQPLLAKKLFVFDAEAGELRPVMGRAAAAVTHVPANDEQAAVQSGVAQVVESADKPSVNLADLSQQLGQLADQAELAEHAGVARAAREAAASVVQDDPAQAARALVDLSQTSAVDAPETDAGPASPKGASADETQESEDDDLRAIFLEEAREVQAAGLLAVRALHETPTDLEQLTTLRRAFHTLKGSARMVGLGQFGEAAWAMEQVLNAILAEQRPAGQALLMLAQDALQTLGEWAGAIEAEADANWQADAFVESARQLTRNGVYQPLQQQVDGLADVVQGLPEVVPSALDGTTVTVDAPEAPAAEPTSSSPDPAGEAVIGSMDPGVAEPAPEAPLLTLPEVDLPALDEPTADESDAPVDFMETQRFSLDDTASSLWLAPEEAPAPMLEGLDLEALGRLSDKAAQPEGVQPPPDEGGLPAPEGAGLAEPPVLPEPEAPASMSVEGAAVEIPEPAAEDGLPDDQTRVIGPLRIGIRLYNVYLNEADEWSRRLCTCLEEWALEHHLPVPAEGESLAHSLAGASAAVGFQPLTTVARALEHALGAVALHQQDGVAASPEQAQLFVEAANDIRRLLHQFAAGFYKEPPIERIDALERLLHEPVVRPADAPLDIELVSQWSTEPSAEPATDGTDGVGELDHADTLPTTTVADPVHVGVGENTDRGLIEDAASDSVFAPSGLSELSTELAPLESAVPGVAQDIDDDIDALDTIDADLFPVFTEEALELLPQLGGALRHWLMRPDNLSARSEVLRTLHTLKGSARLSGALRLGEMAHRMETAAERLGTEQLLASDIEPLLGSFDALSARFDLLRQIDARPQNVVQTAAELETTEAVPVWGDAESGGSPAADAAAEAQPAVTNMDALEPPRAPKPLAVRTGAAVRVRPELLDRLVSQTGEVMITRSRMEAELLTLRGSLKDLTGNLDRLRQQLRDIELQAETQMQSRLAQARDADQSFDPLEFDRFTRVQELTRMMAESVNDVATVQRNLQRAVEATEDGLVAQGRQTRELQRDLLRTRMVEFEGISERLYRVVRQTSKETGKQVRLDIVGGHIEMDRGVLDRMTAAFEHLLRNSVVHGIEPPEQRLMLGKPAEGRIEVRLAQELNDVSVVFQDDGAGLDLPRLRDKAQLQGLVPAGASLSDAEAAQLVFAPGLTTASEVSAIAGRGVGMDVVRTEVVALGGRIEIQSAAGQGSAFKLVLPLTTAVTQVVMVRAGALSFGVPSNLVELVRRVTQEELAQAYADGALPSADGMVPFFWAGALLQSSAQSSEPQARTLPVVIFRSAAQRLALHVDEVLGNQEVVVKNLGPQLSRLPGLAGMSVLASGAVALIYNPVALAAVYGTQVPGWVHVQQQKPTVAGSAVDGGDVLPSPSAVPMVLVVDDSITVRRVTQRLLQREGYRVALASDGLQALERLQQERPTVVLSDIEMPRMDGFDLVRNIRSDPRLQGLPVIMITSRIAAKHRELARELGVSHYLGKPYSEDELLALIAHYAQIAAPA